MTDDVFEDLVNLYLDKEINPAQLTILKDELGRNCSRQKTFESYCRMHQATHFAALTARPVIPLISPALVGGRNKPAFFALNRQVFAAAALIVVIGSFATIYFSGPFGSARMVRADNSSLQKIETFAEATVPNQSEPPLEFFRALKAQNESPSWSYVQELRHARSNSGLRTITEAPSFYTKNEDQPNHREGIGEIPDFELEYSSYEFKR
ncbi:MAG: hypothetical protein O3C43_04620 [Verrucomicrobia bacterium]|nr:hypothetical protein [Verrucomicrobiota bacterium]MDA1065767.1 hypothetical protein [Verrucomicrobiota bacterium]